MRYSVFKINNAKSKWYANIQEFNSVYGILGFVLVLTK